MTELLRAWGWAAAIAANALLAWIGWSLRRQFVTHVDLSAALDRHQTQSERRADAQAQATASLVRATEALAERLTRVEEAARHAPSHVDMTRVHERLDKVYEELRAANTASARIEGTMAPLKHLLELLTEQRIMGGGR